jgi:hypothetical protein
MKPKIFIVLTIFAFASCQLSSDQNNQPNSPTSDTTKTFSLTKPSNQNYTTTGTFVAKLKDGIEETNAIVNDSTIFKAKKGQLFVYENYSHNAWIADGRSAFIPPEQIVKADTPYFKFNFSKWSFVKDSDYKLTQAGRRAGVDLNDLLQKARKKNSEALRTFIKLHDKVDGAASEEFYYDFWAMINIWTDSELSAFAKSLNKADKKEFAGLLFDTGPLSNVINYYQLYYPMTLREIKAAE